MTSELPLNAPRPRLCHIVKWPDFDGYGFNLHADKSRAGQYIGKVDEDSPADIAGIKEGDRIIEVNGVNISNENHKQVVQRIKAVSNETRLLVVDSESDRWYKSHNLIVRGDQDNIIYGSSQKSSSPPSVTVANGTGSSSISNEDGDTKSVGSAISSSHSENSTQPQHNDSKTPSIQDTPPVESLTLEDDVPPRSEENRDSESPDPALEYDNIRFEHDAEKTTIDVPGAQPGLETGATPDLETDAQPGLETSVQPGHEPVTVQPSNEPVTGREDKISLSSKSSAASSVDQKSNDVGSTPVDTEGGMVEKEESIPDSSDTEDRKSPMSTTPSPPPTISADSSSLNTEQPSQVSPVRNSTSGSRGLNLNMTAAEMRAQLASKKKFDPRNDSIDLKKKYQIVQNM